MNTKKVLVLLVVGLMTLSSLSLAVVSKAPATNVQRGPIGGGSSAYGGATGAAGGLGGLASGLGGGGDVAGFLGAMIGSAGGGSAGGGGGIGGGAIGANFVLALATAEVSFNAPYGQ